MTDDQFNAIAADLAERAALSVDRGGQFAAGDALGVLLLAALKVSRFARWDDAFLTEMLAALLAENSPAAGGAGPGGVRLI